MEEETQNSYGMPIWTVSIVENHFSIELKSFFVADGSPALWKNVAGLWQGKNARGLREQVEDWEEFQELTVSQRERLLASSDFTRRLLAQLRSSSAYQETYWEAVPEVAAAL